MKRIFSLIIIVCWLFAACQATPKKVVVINGEHLMEKIEKSPASFELYDAPSVWQETLTMKGSDTEVEINAAISVPNVTAFPVYKVKQVEFDVSRIEFLVDYFTKGKDVTGYTERTKAELEKELILAKKNNDEEMVAEFERQIEEAPEYVKAEIITDWSADQSPYGHFTEEDGIESSISAVSDRFRYMNGSIMTNSILELNGIEVDNEILISVENAVESAQNMLSELEIDYMVAANVEKAQYYSSIDDAFGEFKGKPLSKGYLIKFARNVDGIAGIISHACSYRGSEVINYSAPLYPEEIQIFVNEAGEPKSFVWQYPLEIMENINENVSMLPFEDIKERIRAMLKFLNSYDSEPAIVTDVELNMTIINVKDHPDEAMYVPAWFIYYTIEFDDFPDENDEVLIEKIKQEFVIALNAIDGGRIVELPVETISDMQEE